MCMELSKNDSKMLQGLSVLAMVWLHLFDRDYHGLFTPIVFWGGIPLSYYVGQLSDFCVFGFAFLSGYAHMLRIDQKGYYKRRLKGLLSVLCSYWEILVVFTVISIIIGQTEYMPSSARKFILSIFLLESYNGAWWYLFTYMILVVISPVVLKWVQKRNPIIILCTGFVIYCTAYYIRFDLDCSNWLLDRIGPFGMTFFEYLLGAIAFKYHILSFLYNIWERLNKILRWGIALTIIGGMLYGHTKIVPSLFIAPFTGFVLMMLFHFWNKPQFIQDVFLLIGKHSTNIWLIHMFFYLYLFENLIYIAKYPILIFVSMLIITIALSVVLKRIEDPIQQQISRI